MLPNSPPPPPNSGLLGFGLVVVLLFVDGVIELVPKMFAGFLLPNNGFVDVDGTALLLLPKSPPPMFVLRVRLGAYALLVVEDEPNSPPPAGC